LEQQPAGHSELGQHRVLLEVGIGRRGKVGCAQLEGHRVVTTPTDSTLGFSISKFTPCRPAAPSPKTPPLSSPAG
jgi:hypothetical protein